MSEWISVKDRLPEKEGDRVIIFVPKKMMSDRLLNITYLRPECIDTAHYFKDGWNMGDDQDEYKLDEVTHWMPMPEAPSLEEQMTDDDWRRDTQDMQDTDIG